MKIRGKIFSIVGLMGLISLLISGMAGYALVEYNARLDAFDNASYQAQLGERLNRNVTAVVMDSRGIYASDTTDEATKFATGLMANLDAVDATLEEWRPLILAEQMPAFESLIERTAEFRNFRSETARLGRDVDPALANEQGNNEANRANRKAYQAEIDAFTEGNVERLLAVKGDLDAFRQSMMLMIGITAVLGLVLGVSGAAYLGTAQLSRPIRRLTETMTAYAHGDFSAEVSYAGRKDEIGEIARAVEVFRENGIKVAQMTEEEQARAQRTLTRAQTMEKFQAEFGEVVDVALRGDFSRRINSRFDDEDISRIAGSFNRLIASVDGGLQDAGSVLSALADSDLNREMTGDHKGAFRDLQLNVNRVSETLRDTVLKLRDTSRALKTATGEILSGANDLSERTTKQAATIEETSAAMENIAATVLENVKEAQDASEGAENVRVTAETGGQVMQQATEAMERITNSSAKISNIIGMIDDIAFQTNLLALNASVEAARAGEAGKGFAVVAVEVRRLAQSAAEASSEVKSLIEQSVTEVDGGTRLVAKAAESLSSMLEAARSNTERMISIARKSQEQAASIEEVNQAVRQMDEMTQHNAALVEETNAAIEQTEAQATELDQIVAIFQIDDQGVGSGVRIDGGDKSSSEKGRGIKALQEKVKTAASTYLSQGNAAIDKDWEEF